MKKIYSKLVIGTSAAIMLMLTGATCDNTSIVKTVIGTTSPDALNRESVSTGITNFAGWFAAGASTITLIFIIYGAILFITAGGKEEQATKAKNTLTWSIIGFILIITSYALVTFFIGRLTK